MLVSGRGRKRTGLADDLAGRGKRVDVVVPERPRPVPRHVRAVILAVAVQVRDHLACVETTDLLSVQTHRRAQRDHCHACVFTQV